MHGLVALFLEVIALVMILLIVGLVALIVLAIATRMIVALIILMTMIGLLVIAIMSVASMIVTVLVAMMLPVAAFTAAYDGKMSRFLLFWLLLIFGNLLKNASCFVGSLTLLKISNELKRVHGHHLVCIRELKLMRLGLRKEDLFALLLHCEQLHCSAELAIVKVADELYSTPHELMHWHDVCNHHRFIVTQFPASCIAGLASMQDLVPVRPTVVAPNCFGSMLDAIAAASSTAAASMGQEVETSYHSGELPVGGGKCCHQCRRHCRRVLHRRRVHGARG